MKEEQRFLFRAQTRAVLPRGVVLHGSSVEQHGNAVVFLAPSGGGKSTIAINLAQKDFFLLADDTIIVADGSDEITRCLPCGTLKLTTGIDNIRPANLKAFIFLEKGDRTALVKLTWEYATYRAIRTESIIAVPDLHVKEREQVRLYLKRLFKAFPSFILRYSLRTDPSEFIRELLQS